MSTMYRCHLCNEFVEPEEREDHLIEHGPAYGAASDPQVTAAQFTEVEGEFCNECCCFIPETEELINKLHTTSCSLHPDNTAKAGPVAAYRQQHGDWANYPGYPRENWRDEVAGDSTSLGYWDWVEQQIEIHEGEEPT